MQISKEAVNAAAEAIMHAAFGQELPEAPDDLARAALEAAAPHMLAEVERELVEAQRVIALLALSAGGKVAITRRAIEELSDETVIETTQDVINGGWVIRARTPTP